ncbi:MAG: HD domain-containing protein [Bacillota bacterium]|nr:HD domain-containing protein [Bacillota bacterium]
MGEKSSRQVKSSVLPENDLLNDAVIFAVERHCGQLRKGTGIPYIVHPIETMSILVNMRADVSLMAAGILHDVIEDTDTSETELLERFGEDVYNLVMSHTEDKSKSWEERKKHAVSETVNAPFRSKMLVLADKVANLRSLRSDYRELGDALWNRFNAPKEKQAWYYGEMKKALSETEGDFRTAEIYGEMVKLCEELFG